VYDGISNHKKLLDTNANFEEFEVDSPEKHLHIKGQTLRIYNPESHQWSIYLLDLDKGELSAPPVVGQFSPMPRSAARCQTAARATSGARWKTAERSRTKVALPTRSRIACRRRHTTRRLSHSPSAQTAAKPNLQLSRAICRRR